MRNRLSLKLSPTHVIGGRPREVAPPSPFEPGQSVATVAPATAAPESLDSAPGTDHFAMVEARRIEMLNEWHTKENSLRARAADLKQQAVTLHLETDEKARTTNDVNGVADARARVNRLLEEERRILNIELPNLQAESAAIGGGTHRAIVELTITAQGRIASDGAARFDRIANNLEGTRRAFDTHLAEIATPETLALAQALADASNVAKSRLNSTVQRLLAARGKASA
jgi:hypothetical protein